MGDKRDSSQETQQQQTKTVTPQMLPEQKEQIRLQLERQKAAQPGLLELDQNLFNLMSPLLQGQQLPGQFSTLGQGIPEDVQRDIIQKSIADITPTFEKLGVLMSGPATQISANLARDIRIESALEQIRQRENLLNISQGFPATVNQPILQSSATLAQQLQGLTPITTTGNASGTSTLYGPSFGRTFSQSFAQSAGNTLGSPSYQKAGFGIGG